MSHFRDWFANHPLHAALDALLAECESNAPQLADELQIDLYTRFRRVVTLVKQTSKKLDPELLPAGLIDRLAQAVANATNQFNSFRAHKNAAALSPAADAMLEHLYLLPRLKFPTGQEIFAAALDDFRSQADKQLVKMQEDASAITDKHLRLMESLQDLQANVKRFESQFEQQKGRIDSLINAQQAAFGDAEKGRNAQIQNQLAQIQRSEADRGQRFTVQ
jgi:hypothetical protein